MSRQVREMRREAGWLPAREVLARSIAAPRLVVVSDYDGTLSQPGVDVVHSYPEAGAVEALCALARLPRTDVAILTGRERSTVTRLLGRGHSHFARGTLDLADGSGTIYAIGHHGAELDPRIDDADATDAAQMDERRLGLESLLLERLRSAFPSLPVHTEYNADAVDTIFVARKRLSVGVHVRSFGHGRSAEQAQRILATVRELHSMHANSPPYAPLHLRSGEFVEEISVASGDKRDGLNVIRKRLGSPVLLLGDDVSDMAALAALETNDTGVVVGPRLEPLLHDTPVCNRVTRLPDPTHAVALLDLLARGRATALTRPQSASPDDPARRAATGSSP